MGSVSFGDLSVFYDTPQQEDTKLIIYQVIIAKSSVVPTLNNYTDCFSSFHLGEKFYQNMLKCSVCTVFSFFPHT